MRGRRTGHRCYKVGNGKNEGGDLTGKQKGRGGLIRGVCVVNNSKMFEKPQRNIFHFIYTLYGAMPLR